MITTAPTDTITGEFVPLLGETYYRIDHYDRMAPFFISVVSSSDHWLFVATTGGLTAGRVNADHAIFPYYTVDRIIENANNTGSKTIIQVTTEGRTHLWEPFTDRIRTPYTIDRALYKNIPGTALVFEEHNQDLGLVFRYAWRTSEQYGVVKTGWLINQGDNTHTITLTDGVQNILPAHVAAATQNEFSVLMDAYKRSELHAESGVGMFSLSSRLTDLAEPSEALLANTIWHVGLDPSAYLVSAMQLEAIRAGETPQTETDIRGKRGAYFVHTTLELAPDEQRSWHMVAEVDQNGAAVANLINHLNTADLYDAVEQDIASGTEKLRRIVGGADGLQVTGDRLSADHHFANVLFNVMRGGTFADQYNVEKADLLAYIHTHDHNLGKRHANFFAAMPDVFTIQTLKQHVDAQGDVDLIRLCYTYLPLTFSRRHGDPSRPWNRFSIYLRNPDGSPRLNYEGNWRDIFQNWEALAFAYPAFLEGMVAVFLNATTADGYNPYRITRDGIDWEVPEPDNPWANIGYWSDHQIIYLQKLLEACERFYPGKMQAWLNQPLFTHADVPYRIKPYAEIVKDPYNTITYDWEAASRIEARVAKRGTDGKLVVNRNGQTVHVTLTEKLLNLLLAKLVNFVPDGGIWMNTQRPEWNDANNALVGKGLSVVTTSYLRRYVVFFRALLAGAPAELTLSEDLHTLFVAVQQSLATYEATPTLTDQDRRAIVAALGKAGSDYRAACYGDLSIEHVQVYRDALSAFLATTEAALNRTIAANRREDALYHAYNTLHLGEGIAQVRYLQVMLEGQVAALSAGLLEPDAVLDLLTALRESTLYRADQHSYILYPDKDLPGFLKKNTVDAAQVQDMRLVRTLVQANDPRLLVKDTNGDYHFGGEMRNVQDVRALLDQLAQQPDLAPLVAEEAGAITALFEQVFEHDRFTGRSGSFFAYEGLGSIYWHMVSKLLLAVQENVYMAAAMDSPALPALIDAYYDVRAGLGFNKSPAVYGAFPLDPYSHSPANQGAKQPGMTGMVKEEVLTRLGELGIVITEGLITFDPVLLRDSEWLPAESSLAYWGVDNALHTLDIPAGAYAFTLCRVPILVTQAAQNQIELHLDDGTHQVIAGHQLDAGFSARIFAHDGGVQQVTICYAP